MERSERLINASKKLGTRHTRKLRKYSDGFNEKFMFFFRSYCSGILTFCGESVDVEFEINAVSAKEGFRLYDDGFFKNKNIASNQSNILRAVIIGKKAWGLWLDQFSMGIADWSFTKEEIVEEFTKHNIIIPDAFMLDFENRIKKYRNKIYDDYLKQNKLL